MVDIGVGGEGILAARPLVVQDVDGVLLLLYVQVPPVWVCDYNTAGPAKKGEWTRAEKFRVVPIQIAYWVTMMKEYMIWLI